MNEELRQGLGDLKQRFLAEGRKYPNLYCSIGQTEAENIEDDNLTTMSQYGAYQVLRHTGIDVKSLFPNWEKNGIIINFWGNKFAFFPFQKLAGDAGHLLKQIPDNSKFCVLDNSYGDEFQWLYAVFGIAWTKPIGSTLRADKHSLDSPVLGPANTWFGSALPMDAFEASILAIEYLLKKEKCHRDDNEHKNNSEKLRDAGKAIGDIARACGNITDQQQAKQYIRDAFNKALEARNIINDAKNKYHGMKEGINGLWDNIQLYADNPEDRDSAVFISVKAEFLVRGKEISGEIFEEKRQVYLGFEQLMKDWADKLEQEKPDNSNKDEMPRLELASERLEIRIDDNWHTISESQKNMLEILIKAEGGWIGGKNIGGRPDKLRKNMPEAVSNIIETDKREGYCLKSEYFR